MVPLFLPLRRAVVLGGSHYYCAMRSSHAVPVRRGTGGRQTPGVDR